MENKIQNNKPNTIIASNKSLEVLEKDLAIIKKKVVFTSFLINILIIFFIIITIISILYIKKFLTNLENLATESLSSLQNSLNKTLSGSQNSITKILDGIKNSDAINKISIIKNV